MLIYIFLLLCITVPFYSLFGSTNLISGRFYHLGWLEPLGFSPCSINPSCSFASLLSQEFSCYYLFGWYPSLGVLERELDPSCTLYWFVLDYISFFQAQTVSHTAIFYLILFCGYSGHVCLFTFWQTYSDPAVGPCFLLRQPLTFCQVMSLLGKTIFCANGHVQLHCCAISFSTICWRFTILLPIISVFFFLSLPALLMLCPIIGPFIFMVLGFPFPFMEPGLVLCEDAYCLAGTPGCCTCAA